MVDEAVLAAEFSRRHGVSTRTRLLARGLTSRQIDTLIRRRRLIKAGQGVLVDACSPHTFLRDVAVSCAATRGAASHHTALRIWGFRKAPPSDDQHVTVDWARRVAAPPRTVLHRCTALHELDIVSRLDGITVLSPARTMVDAGALVPAADLESMLEQGLSDTKFTLHTVTEVCERLWHPARPGACALARVLGARPIAQRPVRSDLELRLDRALRARGFPPLVREHPVRLPDGAVVHPDLGIPEDRFYIEVDHPTWHTGADAEYDSWRDKQVRLAGNHVERVSNRAIDDHLEETVELLWNLWHAARAVHRGA